MKKEISFRILLSTHEQYRGAIMISSENLNGEAGSLLGSADPALAKWNGLVKYSIVLHST